MCVSIDLFVGMLDQLETTLEVCGGCAHRLSCYFSDERCHPHTHLFVPHTRYLELLLWSTGPTATDLIKVLLTLPLAWFFVHHAYREMETLRHYQKRRHTHALITPKPFSMYTCRAAAVESITTVEMQQCI